MQATANRIDIVDRLGGEDRAGPGPSVDDLEPGPEARRGASCARTVARNPELVRAPPSATTRPSTAAFAPYAYQPSGVYGTEQSPEMKAAIDLVITDLGRDGRAYEVGDWYQLPVPDARRRSGPSRTTTRAAATWSWPRTPSPSTSRDDPAPVSAVISGDVSLFWLSRLLQGLDLGETGYAFLISQTGTFIAHPDHDLIMNESIFSVAEARDDPSLRDLGPEMISGASRATSRSTGSDA